MTLALWQRAQEVFLDALEQPAGRRQSAAHDACAGDRELWEAVSRLLAGHETPGGLLSIPEPPAPDEDLHLPCLLGAYRLQEKIGAGGMGAVYRAVRADGQFEMQAAVKLMAGGPLNAKSVGRFLTERQILANLDHYHIARLLDGGVSEDGRPYIVMEHVDGVPIDCYCRSRGLTVEETVQLFEKVCAAAEYAHRNGVIHRDIKPGNLLVTSAGTPKLLDFGISKLLDAEDAPDAAATLDRSRALTPDYASPEQLLGRPATPASDVYSLGVLLYKLLYGERPNGDPSLLAKGRRIARDLDAIVTKALAHRPEDRYPSGKELREDLERYRRALPVAARPRSMPRTAKLARRYRWQAITVTVLVAAIATVGYLVRDNRRKVVERRRQAVMAILTLFFDNDRREIGVPQSADTRRMALQPMLRKLEALERDSGEDAEVLYRIAIGYVFVGRIQAGFPTAVGDYGSGLQTYQRAAALAARAVAKSGGIREKQLLAQILHRVIITALWSNEGRAASVAAADGFQMMKASQAQFRQAGLGDFAVYYRIAFSIHRAHILQSENRLEEAAGLWSAALRELPTEVVLKDSSLGYVGIYSAFEANLRLAEHFCWSGNPRAGIPYAAAAEVLAARTSKITHDPDLERQARVIGAVCDTKASRPREALHTLDSLQRAYQKDLENQPQNTNFKEALANVGRLAGDAMVAIGDLTSAEEAYRSAQSFLLSPAEFANSPTAQIRTAQIAASLGQLESQRANRSPRGSARAVRHWKAACASYEQADAIFRKRRTGVMYIEDRVAMAEVEGAFSACEAAGDRIAPK